jgi:aconitate hydratase
MNKPTRVLTRWQDRSPPGVRDVQGAQVLLNLGDSITTDHISPAGAIARDSPAARFLTAHGYRERGRNKRGSG